MLLILSCLLGLLCLTSAGLVPGRTFDRIITIWLENQDYDKVTIDSHIADLKKEGILLSRFYALTHPSQPNYVAAVAGDYFGLDHDEFARIPENVSTIIDLLGTRSISWKGYFEDLPGPGYMGMGSDGPANRGGKWMYVRKHNPFISYDGVSMDGHRLLHILSFQDFNRDLAARKVPQCVFMSPNMDNDGHDTTLERATSWSHDFLKPLIKDDAFDEKTLIMLTYDESEDYSKPNHIVTLLLGSAIPPALKGTTDDTFYTHYSMLSTVEYNWDLPNLGRYDVGANVFDFVISGTPDYKNREPENAASVNNSVSYPGALHSDPSKYLAIPPPNLQLVGPTKKPVLESVRNAWASQQDQPTPYDGSGNVRDGDLNLPLYKAQGPNQR